jgi:hypothetical protein
MFLSNINHSNPTKASRKPPSLADTTHFTFLGSRSCSISFVQAAIRIGLINLQFFVAEQAIHSD